MCQREGQTAGEVQGTKDILERVKEVLGDEFSKCL